MLEDKIWEYISSRVDNDNVFPHDDEIYTEFSFYFEALQYDPNIINEMVKRFASITDLSGVKMEWEGELV